MEIFDPVPEMIIPVTAGKRTMELRLRTRAECRELIRAAALAGGQLPDDGHGALTLLTGAVTRAIPVAADPSMTLVAIMEALAPMNRSQLRAVIVDAWSWQAAGVEQAISDVQARAAERDGARAAHASAAAVLERSIATGTRLAVVDDMDDEALPDCAGCGHPEVLHANAHGGPIATGPCGSCACTAYQLPQEPREQADPGYLEGAAALDEDDDGYARLARGEQAAAEVDEARSRERRSDSAVGPLAEDEPDDGDPQYPDVSGGGVPYPASKPSDWSRWPDGVADYRHDPRAEWAAGDDSAADAQARADERTVTG